VTPSAVEGRARSRLAERSRRRSRNSSIVVVVDQLVSSGTNFATALLAARWLGAGGFGPIALALSAAYLLLMVVRAAVGEPLLTFLPLARDRDERALRISGALSCALLLGLMLATIYGTVSALGGPFVNDLRWIALCAPIIAFQDTVRYVGLATSPRIALVSDVVWAAVQAILFAGIYLFLQPTSVLLLGSWGAGALAGAGYGLVVLWPRHFGRYALDWLRLSRSLSSWLVGQSLVGQIGNAVSVIVLAGVIGADDFAGYRAVEALYRPALVLVPAWLALFVPRMALMTRSANPMTLHRSVVRYSMILLGLAGAAIVAFVILSRPIIALLLGRTYLEFRPLVAPLGAGILLQVAQVPAAAALRAMQDGRRIMAAQSWSLVIGIPAMLLTAASYGAVGAAWGYLMYCVVQIVAYSELCRRSLRANLVVTPAANASMT
jgi:O-antigen/teichoic acid export membrane protein